MLPTKLLISRARNLVARKFGHPHTINATTCAIETLYSGQTFPHPSPLYLPDQLEKVKGVPFGNPISRETDIIEAKTHDTAPVLRLEVKNAILTGKYLYAGKLRNPFNHRAPSTLPRRLKEVDVGELKSSMMGCGYFGHWLRDDCATHLLVDARPGTQLVMGTPHWGNKADYAMRFDQDWTTTEPTYVRNLTLYLDSGQNPHKAERFRTLRQRVRNKAKPSGAEIVYLKRGPQSSSRQMTNEAALIELIEGMGGRIYEAESDIATLEQIALDARIMIGVEGSQLSHALYMLRDGGGLMVLQPPYRFFTSHLDWCRHMEMPFAFMVGDPDGDGFSMDLDVFKRSLDLLDRNLP